jgi:hypothetical protein
MKDTDKRPSEALGFVREITLQAVDSVINLEEKENAAGGGKTSHNYISRKCVACAIQCKHSDRWHRQRRGPSP